MVPAAYPAGCSCCNRQGACLCMPALTCAPCPHHAAQPAPTSQNCIAALQAMLPSQLRMHPPSCAASGELHPCHCLQLVIKQGCCGRSTLELCSSTLHLPLLRDSAKLASAHLLHDPLHPASLMCTHALCMQGHAAGGGAAAVARPAAVGCARRQDGAGGRGEGSPFRWPHCCAFSIATWWLSTSTA